MTRFQSACYAAAVDFALGLMTGVGVGAWIIIFGIMGGVFG